MIGGANSAGQAALFLAESRSRVHLVVRADDLGKEMSAYLVDRVVADPRISVHTGTQVTALHGDGHLEQVTLTPKTGEPVTVDCSGLFCFIGAAPATDWITGVALDDDGFVLTDAALEEAHLPETWKLLGRRPLPFETSVPAVFAAGDVRRGSMKRVAAAVGEGASAVRSVHAAIAAIH